MNVFKLDVNSKETFEISLYNLEQQTKRQVPWFQPINNHAGWFAVCPLCNNPIIINGLNSEKISVYGKHFTPQPGQFEHKLKGIVDHDEMKCCPYYSAQQPLDRKKLRPEGSELSFAILQVVKEHFDRIVYLLEKTIGIKITNNLAIQMLEDYKSDSGWRYRGSTLDNIPWTLAHMLKAQNLFGRIVINEGVADDLKQHCKDIVINEAGQIISDGEHQLKFCFIHHEQKVINNNLNESIIFDVSDKNQKTVYVKKIDFDYLFFKKLINATGTYRNTKLIKLANEILP